MPSPPQPQFHSGSAHKRILGKKPRLKETSVARPNLEKNNPRKPPSNGQVLGDTVP
jgi:hypothetical protein